MCWAYVLGIACLVLLNSSGVINWSTKFATTSCNRDMWKSSSSSMKQETNKLIDWCFLLRRRQIFQLTLTKRPKQRRAKRNIELQRRQKICGWREEKNENRYFPVLGRFLEDFKKFKVALSEICSEFSFAQLRDVGVHTPKHNTNTCAVPDQVVKIFTVKLNSFCAIEFSAWAIYNRTDRHEKRPTELSLKRRGEHNESGSKCFWAAVNCLKKGWTRHKLKHRVKLSLSLNPV